MATGRARVSNHGQNHRGPGAGGTAGGSDPAFLNVDSTANVGRTQGVRSYMAQSGWALLSDGEEGSVWGPAGELVVGTFPEEMANLAALRELRGWWRVGELSGDALDTSGYLSDPADATLQSGSNAITRNVTGCIAAADDDGAIQGTDSTGADGEFFAIPQKGGRFELKSQDFTLAAWIRPTAVVAGKNFLGVITNMSFSTAPFGWGLGTTSAGKVMFRRETALSPAVVRLEGPVLVNGEDYFLVATYDTTDGHKIYVNGNLAAVDPQTFNVSESTSQTPYIGAGATIGVTPISSYFYGVMDELSIWGDALTATEVAILTEAGGIPTSTETAAFTTYGNYSLGIDDDFILAADAITATITLPLIADVAAGKRYTVKKGSSGTGTITVARNGANIDGAASDVSITTANQAREFTSDGTGWRISAGYL